jgi:transcriptional regulator with XRE-family HTH domain
MGSMQIVERRGGNVATTVQKIIRALKSRGYSQEAYESRVGLAKGRLSKWSSGQGEPTASQAWRIAGDLALDITYLLDPEVEEPRLPGRDEFRVCTEIMHRLGPEESFRRLTHATGELVEVDGHPFRPSNAGRSTDPPVKPTSPKRGSRSA